jgi:hypothetical protein
VCVRLRCALACQYSSVSVSLCRCAVGMAVGCRGLNQAALRYANRVIREHINIKTKIQNTNHKNQSSSYMYIDEFIYRMAI